MTNQIYDAPLSSLGAGVESKQDSKFSAVLSILFMCGPIVLVIGLAIWVAPTYFSHMDNPDIDQLLWIWIQLHLGFSLFPILGLCLWCVVLFKSINREVWFYKSSKLLAIAYCVILAPIGLIWGGLILYILTKKRSEFLN